MPTEVDFPPLNKDKIQVCVQTFFGGNFGVGNFGNSCTRRRPPLSHAQNRTKLTPSPADRYNVVKIAYWRIELEPNREYINARVRSQLKAPSPVPGMAGEIAVSFTTDPLQEAQQPQFGRHFGRHSEAAVGQWCRVRRRLVGRQIAPPLKRLLGAESHPYQLLVQDQGAE